MPMRKGLQEPFPKLQWQQLERGKDKETWSYGSGKNSCDTGYKPRMKEVKVELGSAHTRTEKEAGLHTHCKDQYL